MDTTHLIIIGALTVQAGVLGFIAWCSVKVLASIALIEDTAAEVAKIADRNERMTMDILRKVHEVNTPHA